VEIGNSAFLNDFSLTGSLTLGKYLVTIGDSAFGDCYYLTSVNLRNVVNILPLAFAHCSYLSGRLIIPPSVEFIGDCAFALCESLLGCENHSIFFK
jgi:hypothetical protein